LQQLFLIIFGVGFTFNQYFRMWSGRFWGAVRGAGWARSGRGWLYKNGQDGTEKGRAARTPISGRLFGDATTDAGLLADMGDELPFRIRRFDASDGHGMNVLHGETHGAADGFGMVDSLAEAEVDTCGLDALDGRGTRMLAHGFVTPFLLFILFVLFGSMTDCFEMVSWFADGVKDYFRLCLGKMGNG